MSVLLRLAIWGIALCLALLPVVAVLNGWLAADRWPIEQLRIHAEYQRVDAEQIRSAVVPQATRGFFAVDLDAVQRAVQGVDWVAAAEVRKIWPNLLEITIHEHQPYARWGDQRLLSARGQLFPLPAQGLDLQLPTLQAGDEHVGDLMQVYGAAAPLFALHGSQLSGVRLSARGSWTFRLDDGAVVMAGRGDPMPSLQRFVPLFAELRAVERRPLVRADLRYANGFALRWGDAEPAPATRGSGPGGLAEGPPSRYPSAGSRQEPPGLSLSHLPRIPSAGWSDLRPPATNPESRIPNPKA